MHNSIRQIIKLIGYRIQCLRGIVFIYSSLTWKSQWKVSPTSGQPMEPCGSGSLHARSRVMLHLNSHSSRETTSNSSTGNTAQAAASNEETRQISCPNISSDEQSQQVKRTKKFKCARACCWCSLLDGAPPKVVRRARRSLYALIGYLWNKNMRLH